MIPKLTNLPTKKSMRENINEIVDCLERKTTNMHAKVLDMSPILGFQQGF